MSRVTAPAGGAPSRAPSQRASAGGGAGRDQRAPFPVRLLDRVLGTRGCLFTFHRVARTEDWAALPDRGFYLDLGFLDALLGHLRRTGWDIVTVEEALRRVRAASAAGRTAPTQGSTAACVGGRTVPQRRFVNFSIDDCYRDTWDLAVPLFRRHGAPVTLYVTTGIPDRTHVMWTTGLEAIIARETRVLNMGSPIETGTADEKRKAYAMLRQAWEQGDPKRAYAAFCAENGADPARIHDQHAIEWDMLAELRDDPLVEIGGHTVTHPRVSTLQRSEALAELAGCRARLRERLGVDARHFAFPYGRAADAGPRDFDLARQAGYASAATTRKGLLRLGDSRNRAVDPYSLPRNTLNGAHRSLLLAEAQLAGVTGLAARLLGRV